METKFNYSHNVYMPQLLAAQEFQDFVSIELMTKGMVLSNMSSQKYQNEKGENLQGFEIKYDRNFRKTGNLYIEVAEKSDPDNYRFIESGIFRNDNSWIYLVGDYNGFYLMQKKILKAIYGKNIYKNVETKTSKGMLLPCVQADVYFDYIQIFKTPQPQ